MGTFVGKDFQGQHIFNKTVKEIFCNLKHKEQESSSPDDNLFQKKLTQVVKSLSSVPLQHFDKTGVRNDVRCSAQMMPQVKAVRM